MRRTHRLRRAGLAIGLAALAVTLTAGPAAADPPTNSSFELPDIPDNVFQTFPAGSTGITGWVVFSGSIDIHDSGASIVPSADGDQHVDLAGDTPGVLRQVFNTLPNTGYTISWNFGASTGVGCGAPTKTGTFSVQGAAVETMSVTGAAGTANWQTRSTAFTGTGGGVTLQFADTSGSNCGLAIDNVNIVANTAIPIVDPKVAGVVLTLAAGGGLYLLHRKRTRDELDGALAA